MAFAPGPTGSEAGNKFTQELNPTTAAKYYELNAQYNLSVAQSQANAKLSKELAQANFQYGRSNLLRSEPQRIHSNMNAANSQGLAESGQLAKAQTQTQQEYASKGTGLSMQRDAAIKRATLSQSQAEERATTGELTGLNTAKAEQAQYIAEHPPQTPNGVAPSPTTNLPPGYTATTQKGGSVSISISKAARKAAAKKAVG
jgi:hypothetical protein